MTRKRATGKTGEGAVPPQARRIPVRGTLFGTGQSQATLRAQANLERILGELGIVLESLEYCDMIEHAGRAFEEGILATPTLVLEVTGSDQRVRIAGSLDNSAALHRAIEGLDHLGI